MCVYCIIYYSLDAYHFCDAKYRRTTDTRSLPMPYARTQQKTQQYKLKHTRKGNKNRNLNATRNMTVCVVVVEIQCTGASGRERAREGIIENKRYRRFGLVVGKVTIITLFEIKHIIWIIFRAI